MQKDWFVSTLLDVYGEFLAEKQQALLNHYYNEDLSLSEIAENEGITRQGVCDSIKRGEAQLRRLEEQYHYAEKFTRMKQLLPAVKQDDAAAMKQLIALVEEL
ncbi:MAG: DNA-binding protein [Clostridia bacterium]|nr:DNA-binding protein [Clostridia bacterium]